MCFFNPTLHNLFCSRFCRPGRNKYRSHPSTGCTLHTLDRLRATPDRERLSVCTGHGSDFHILHTSRILASLQRVHRLKMHPKETRQTAAPFIPIMFHCGGGFKVTSLFCRLDNTCCYVTAGDFSQYSKSKIRNCFVYHNLTWNTQPHKLL